LNRKGKTSSEQIYQTEKQWMLSAIMAGHAITSQKAIMRIPGTHQKRVKEDLCIPCRVGWADAACSISEGLIK
jgi:hypothetical protein